MKRGIYRDFPTTYQDRFGRQQSVGFQVLEVLRNGQPDGSRIEDTGKQVRVYVGKAHVLLPPADYTYTLAYRTTNQLSFFEDHDELYWNVTGNGWGFFIDQASATVTLPKAVPRRKLHLEGYTGRLGAKGQDFTSKVSPDRKGTFLTTRVLAPHEGLTIVVSFPKGLVAPPKPGQTPPKQATTLPVQPSPPPSRKEEVAETWQAAVAGLVGVLVIVGYYMIIWLRVGRDPEGGAIMPLYKPPENLSPAAVRYVTRQGFDDRIFAVAVLNMAVKGHISIRDDSGTYTLLRKGEGSAGLSEDERLVSAKLLDSSGSIVLQMVNHARIRSALQAMEARLRSSLQKIYFHINRRYIGPGILLTALALGAVLNSMNLSVERIVPGTLAVLFFVPFASIAVVLGSQAVRAGRLGGAIFTWVRTLFFLLGAFLCLWGFSEVVTVWAAGLLAAMAVINSVFYFLLDAPTRAGRRALDQIAGFKMFLAAVEGDRLRMQGEQRTPQLFEKYLPYALALDVEHQWAEQFSDVFSALAAAGGDRDFSPSWYSSTGRKHRSASDFASSVARPLAQEAQAAAISPVVPSSRSYERSSSSSWGRSSGSGGRGSSGGGGGGGGGGGW
ncbi:MAG: DUF2207 domain-containing protein [Terriglobales bacterium]